METRDEEILEPSPPRYLHKEVIERSPQQIKNNIKNIERIKFEEAEKERRSL